MDSEPPHPIPEKPLRRPDCSSLRRRRRHQRLHRDSRKPRRRQSRIHPHRRRQAPAIRRRQSGSNLHLAGGIKVRRATLAPPAQRPPPSMRRRQRAPAGRPQLTEGGNHSTRRGFRPGGWHTQDRNHPRRSHGANARRLPSLLRTNRQAERRKAQPLPRTGPALRLRSSRNAPLGSISQHRRSSAGRDSLQWRILHP